MTYTIVWAPVALHIDRAEGAINVLSIYRPR
jgi:hypothetical protein